MELVLTDASLFRLVVSFQAGLPGRIHSYWRQHRSTEHGTDDGATGALVALAVRRRDCATLAELHALWMSSFYYRSMALLQFRNVVSLAAREGQDDILAWLHATLRDGITCDPLAATAAALDGHTQALEWLLTHCTRCNTELSVEIAKRVAQYGYSDVVQCLYNHRPELFASLEVLTSAVGSGRLEIVRFLHEQLEGPTQSSRCCRGLLDKAAAAGHIEVVRYLHEACSAPATTEAMDVAAANGHLSVVHFLHEHRTEGCTVFAMDQAAAQGHLDVVQFLHAHRREGCTVYAMGGASRRGHLEVLRFLHEHRHEGCSSWALAEAAEKGHFEVVEFLHTHRMGMDWEDSALFRAARNGHLDVVHYLCDHTRIGDRVFDARRAAKTAGKDEVVKVLDIQIKKLLDERDQEQREKLRRRKHAKAKKKRK